MSRLFCAVRFGAFVAWLVLLMSALSLTGPAHAQAQAPALTLTVAVATKQVTVGVAMTPYTPVTAAGLGGTYRFQMETPLPDGLRMNPETGEISGTPGAVAAMADYTVLVMSGDAGARATFKLEVTKAVPTINFTATPNPAFVGATISLRATVDGGATGTVTFRRDGVADSLATVNLSGTGIATLDVNTLPRGTTRLRATYNGDANFATVTTTVNVTVALNPVTLTLASDKIATKEGQALVLTATIAPTNVTGNVIFKQNGNEIGQGTINNGVTNFTTPPLQVGAQRFTAEFLGNDTYDSAISSGVQVNVSPATTRETTLELTPDKAQYNLGETVTFTATLKNLGNVATTAVGLISFVENGEALGARALTDGKATFTIATLTAGTHTITAEFNGNDFYAASKSGPVTVQIVNAGKVNTTLQLTASKTVSAAGEIVTFTATITPPGARGQIRFMDSLNGAGAVTLKGEGVQNGQAVYTTNLLLVGRHRIYAVFDPEGDFNTSTSNDVNVTVGQDKTQGATGTTQTTTTVTVDKNIIAYGETVTFSVSVTPTRATGMVVIYDGATEKGSVLALDVNGTGKIALNNLDPGTRQLTAEYKGSATFAPSRSSEVTVTVAQAEGKLTLASNPRSPSAGQTFELRASMLRTGATGKVTFKENGVVLGEANLVAEVAVLRIQNAVLGDHTYTASYSGDARVMATDSAPLIVTVTDKKPTPSADPTVRAMISSQLSTSTRIAANHMSALHLRLETLHEEDVPAFSNGINFSQSGNLSSGVRSYEEDPWVRGSNATPAGRSIDAVIRNDRFNPNINKTENLTLPKLTAPQQFHVWTAGSVMFGGMNYSGLGSASRTNFTLAGLTAGVDAKIAEGLRAGFAVSYSSESSELGGGSGDIKTNMTAGSLYASWKVDRNIFIDALLGYGFANFTSQRMDSNLLIKMPGQRTGHIIMASLGTSYDDKMGSLKYATFARMDIASINLGSYTEQGGESWSIMYQSMQTTAQSLVLGVRAQQDIDDRWGVLSPFGRLEYRHALTVAGVQSIAYSGEQNATYTISPSPTASGTLTGTMGLRAVDRKRLSGSVEYSLSGGQGGVVGQGLRGAMRVGF